MLNQSNYSIFVHRISGKSTGRGPKVAFSLLDNPACTKDSPDACPPSRYRSIDGTCNNLNHTWGVAMKPFRRMLPPDYADGNFLYHFLSIFLLPKIVTRTLYINFDSGHFQMANMLSNIFFHKSIPLIDV